jgi:hypothetical protein
VKLFSPCAVLATDISWSCFGTDFFLVKINLGNFSVLVHAVLLLSLDLPINSNLSHFESNFSQLDYLWKLLDNKMFHNL